MTIAARSWTRPEAVAFNRLPMTTFLRSPAEVVSLDGQWSFTLLDRPGGETITETTVTVPGCWTMQDVGDIPQYTNIRMPFSGPPPRVPDENPTGVYRRHIGVPSDWVDRRIILHVAGADSVVYVTIDGVAVGMGTDSRLPHEFDITGLVTPGSMCDIELTVVRWSAATYLEDQDHWYHAGLHRSVFLYATPRVHILDAHAVADWDPSTGDGRLDVDVAVGGAPTKGAVVRLVLDGAVIGHTDARWEHPGDIAVNAYAFEGRGGRVTATVPRASPWSAEHPLLHDLRVDLAHGDEVLDSVSLRVGFRRVEVRGHELLLNGRAVLMKGVNRHDHDPRTGKTVSRSSMRRDIELMKAHNLNAVRTSHYPNDVHLYDVCDELGMYVVDEANVETHAYQRSLTRSAEWAPAILERVARMAQRDKNHPSVIMWSLGNESGWSPIFDAAAAWLRGFDPSRPVHYENGYHDGVLRGLTPPESWRVARRETDVVPPMYPSVEDLEQWATTAPPTRPLIMCEYEHAMNNSCGDLDRYWEAIRTHAGLQGGFIWDWADQALVQRLTDGTERLAYGGDFGDDPNDGTFCLNGLVAADRTPHPSLLEAKVVLQPVRFAWLGDGGVRITNEHDFTDLGDVADIEWSVSIDGNVVEAGTFGRLTLAPGTSTVVKAPIQPVHVDGWQIAHLTIRCGDIAVAQYELMRSEIRSALATPITMPTRLALWRAPIDNEIFGPRHAERWRDLDLANAHHRIDLRTDVEGALVTHEAVVPDDLDDIARVGVRIELPVGLASVDWIGRGPHECYSDRRAGAIVGRWHTSIDGWGTPYVHPQANGNRTDVRSLRFLDADGRTIVCIDELDDYDVTVSRWSDEELDTARHREDLPTRETIYVWIDVRHRGVGSGAVGPDVSAPHRVGPGTYRWSYRIHRP